MQDGPSSLQKRSGLPTIKEKGGSSPVIYESERETHLNSKERNQKNLREVREKLAGLDSESSKLKSPSATRNEVQKLRDQMSQLKEYNEQ